MMIERSSLQCLRLPANTRVDTLSLIIVSRVHRNRKSLNRLLKVCYVPATSIDLIAFFSCFFAAAINSINEANKAASTHC